MKLILTKVLVLTLALNYVSLVNAESNSHPKILKCDLVEPSVVGTKAVLIELTCDEQGVVQAVNLNLSQDEAVIAKIDKSQISWRIGADKKAQLQTVADEVGIQKCTLANSIATAGAGISLKSQCVIGPRAGVPAEITAKFELRIPFSKIQNSGFVTMGDSHFTTGYILTDCKE